VDEHESIEQRIGHRRAGDLDGLHEMRLLRHEIKVLREKIVHDEVEYEKRITQLEGELSRFRTQLAGAKSFIYALGLAGAAFLALVSDRVKELLIK